MKRFRKKPVAIDAFCLGLDPIPDWFMDKVSANDCILHSDGWRSLEGVMIADKGDFIIKGIKGEIYPCKPDIFAMTYEPVAD